MKKVNILYIIGTLIILNSCSTLKLSEIIANDILDNFNNGGYRYDNSYNNIISDMEESEKDLTISDNYFNNFEEVNKMEDMNILVSAIGSAITAIYVLVKTIFNLVKKFKK